MEKHEPSKRAYSEPLSKLIAYDTHQEEEDQGHPDSRGRPHLVIDCEISVEITSSNDPFSSVKSDNSEIDLQGQVLEA